MCPGRDQLIERAYRGNRPFRELCRDYRKCFVALERWKDEDPGQAVPRWSEYSELLAELRGEIQIWLEAMEPGSYTSPRRDS
jgi:hypothetical protein